VRYWQKYFLFFKQCSRSTLFSLDFTVVLFYINIAAFIVTFVFWMIRWIPFPKNAIVDLKHPIIANFYPTFAVSIMVLSANFLIIGQNIPVAKYLWLIGTGFTVFFPFIHRTLRLPVSM